MNSTNPTINQPNIAATDATPRPNGVGPPGATGTAPTGGGGNDVKGPGGGGCDDDPSDADIGITSPSTASFNDGAHLRNLHAHRSITAAPEPKVLRQRHKRPVYSNTLDAPILRLYRAYFNREPDLAGAKYWLTIRRNGYGLLQIAGFMADGQEFANNYAGINDTEYLRRIYHNVLDRVADQAGHNYWLDLLQGTNHHGLNPNLHQLNRSEVVFYVTDGQEFINNHPYTKHAE